MFKTIKIMQKYSAIDNEFFKTIRVLFVISTRLFGKICLTRLSRWPIFLSCVIK